MPNAFGGREDLEAVSFLRELNEVAARARAGRALDRGGVDGVAGRLAADPPRRARLRLQVEHGLDARHARVLLEGADPPPLPPPRADLLDGLRLERELRPAALARRGRPRQAARCSGGCPATAGSASPTCALSTATCGRIPASSCSSWAASSRQEKEWSEPAGSLDWHLLDEADHAGVQALVRDLNRGLRATSPRSGSSTTRTRASAGSSRTRRTRTCSRSRALAEDGEAPARRAPATSRRSCATAGGSGCRPGASGARRSTPTRASTAARTSATGSGSRRRRRPGTSRSTRSRSRCRRSGRLARTGRLAVSCVLNTSRRSHGLRAAAVHLCF